VEIVEVDINQYMTIWAGTGDKVAFKGAACKDGYEGQSEEYSKIFQKGQVLTVKRVKVYDSSSDVQFEGYPGEYNTSLFVDVCIDEAKATRRMYQWSSRDL
jgi:hypothetical protein